MKRRKIALTLFATFCASAVGGTDNARADNPFEKLIPRGKLIKMLTGDDQKKETPRPQRSTRPRPTPAPTPADQAADRQHPPKKREPDRMANRPSPTRTRPLPPITSGSKKGQTRSNTTGRGKGFGMMVQTSRDNDLVVTAVQASGNAYSAGIRPGDQLISLGGGKLTALDEFKQIAKTLGQGDQIEVGFVRKGKTRKIQLQYGSAPEEGNVAVAGNRVPSPTAAPAEVDANMQSVLDSPVEHISRLTPVAARVPAASPKKITSLNETIESQRLKMQAMAEELQLLRRAHQPAVEPTENNWSFPDLAGPDSK